MPHQYWLSVGNSDKGICVYFGAKKYSYHSDSKLLASRDTPRKKETFFCFALQANLQMTLRNISQLHLTLRRKKTKVEFFHVKLQYRQRHCVSACGRQRCWCLDVILGLCKGGKAGILSLLLEPPLLQRIAHPTPLMTSLFTFPSD